MRGPSGGVAYVGLGVCVGVSGCIIREMLMRCDAGQVR